MRYQDFPAGTFSNINFANKSSKDLTKEDIQKAIDVLHVCPELDSKQLVFIPSVMRPFFPDKYRLGGQAGPWVLERPRDSELTKTIMLFDYFTMFDPLPNMRGMITNTCSEEDARVKWTEANIHLHPNYKQIRRAVSAEMILKRLEILVEGTVTIKYEESECFGKLIWFGLKVLGVV